MKRENNQRQGSAKDRLEAHREMVEDLETLRTELSCARKYMGKIFGANYTGMPKGSPDPGRSPTEEEYIALEKLEARIRTKERKIQEDWEEIETLCLQIKPMQALMIKLRYHYAIEWKEICKEIYGKRSDFESEYERYKNRMFGIHTRGVSDLDKMLENQRLEQK